MTQELLEKPRGQFPATREETRPQTEEDAPPPSVKRRLRNEVLFVGLGYLVYSQVRGLAGGREADAFVNAGHIISLEKSLGIYEELTIQRWILSNSTLVDIFNFIYFYGFFPLLIPIAAWLFWKHPEVYTLARTAFLASGAIAVCFFLTLPTAPPRLLDVGFVDTLNQSLTPTYSEIPGVNHYAALPSMHVGWTFLLALSLAMALSNMRFRWAVYTIPLAMFSATIVTGNHWFVDGALGLLVALAGYALALRIRDWTGRASVSKSVPQSRHDDHFPGKGAPVFPKRSRNGNNPSLPLDALDQAHARTVLLARIL